MSNSKDHSGNQGNDGTKTKNKGESRQNPQKGAPGVSKKDSGKHTKDESAGSEHNITKKQQNSI